MKRFAVLACLLLAAPARAENWSDFAPYILVAEALVFGVSYVSSGAAGSSDGFFTAPRVAGGIEIGLAVIAVTRGRRRYGEPAWATAGAFAGLATYNLIDRGSIPWRIAVNDVGIHLVAVGDYFDRQHGAAPLRLISIPGGLALRGRF
jgi:hypothetical protein